MPKAKKGHSLNPNVRFYPDETKEMAYLMWRKGITLAKIQEETGIPLGTLGSWPKSMNWRARMAQEKISGVPGIAPAEITRQSKRIDDAIRMAELLAPPGEDKGEYAGKSKAELAKTFEDRMYPVVMRIPKILATLTDAMLVDRSDKIAKLVAIGRETLGIQEKGSAPTVNVNLISNGNLPRLAGSSKAALQILDAQAEVLPELPDTPETQTAASPEGDTAEAAGLREG